MNPLSVVIIVVLIFGAVTAGLFLTLKGRKLAREEVEKVNVDNEPLESPCTIHIRVAKNFTPLVGDPWQYGFSLNGKDPVFTDLGGEMELTTNVLHNALLGYGRSTYGSYSKPNIEVPFTFDAVSGGVINLYSDAKVENTGSNLRWRSELSFDESGKTPEKSDN